jgi:hypothetical protein
MPPLAAPRAPVRRTCTVRGGHEDVAAVHPGVRACVDEFRKEPSVPRACWDRHGGQAREHEQTRAPMPVTPARRGPRPGMLPRSYP